MSGGVLRAGLGARVEHESALTFLRSAMVAVALLVSPALASAAEPGAENVAASLKKFDEGRAAFEARRFDEARAAFEASNKLQASPNSLLYIGRCYRETGRLASAYVTLNRSAREANERLTVTLEKRFAATRDAAAAEAAAIEPRVPRLTVVVPGGLPRDFSVSLNGAALGPESWGLALETDPGTVVVEAKGARMRPYRTSFELREGARQRLDVPIDRLPTATLSLVMKSWPAGVAVAIDGVSVPPAEVNQSRELDVGPHVVTASAPSYLPFRWERSLPDGARERVVVDLAAAPAATARRGPAPWLFFATLGGAVVTTAIGTGFALDASARNDTENAKDALLRDPVERDAIRDEGTIANALFVTGAALAVGAAVLFFVTPWRGRSASHHEGVLGYDLRPGGAF